MVQSRCMRSSRTEKGFPAERPSGSGVCEPAQGKHRAARSCAVFRVKEIKVICVCAYNLGGTTELSVPYREAALYFL